MDIIAKTSENKEIFLTACSNSCGGIEGLHGECCSVKGKNWAIGPIKDAQEVLKRFPDLQYEDIFVDFEEGSKMFPDVPAYQDPESYPTMRLSNYRCIFYKDKKCSIYEKRPSLCFTYYCAYLKNLAPFEITHPHLNFRTSL